MRTLVVIATYNEIGNLPQLVDAILGLGLDLELLVIDDNSPDGTGRWVDERAAVEPRLRCIHRAGKLGLGTATLAGLQYALDHNFDCALTLDADFSHHPRHIPELLAGMEGGPQPVDVMIGSRYVTGGGIEGWPRSRRWMSLGVNRYARWMLGLSVRDCSGAFRCYRTAILRRLNLAEVRSKGYAYLEELLWRLKKIGARFAETPIVFTDRTRGTSKITWREATAAVQIITRLGIRNWLGF